MVLLFAIALVLRASGAAVRVNNFRLPIRVVSWVMCTIATWIAVGAVGAWFPLWPMLVLGVIGAFIDFRPNRYDLWIGADIIVVALSGFFSIPPLSFGLLAATAGAVSGIGFAVDYLLVRSPKQARIIIFVLPFAACLAIAVTRFSAICEKSYYLREMLSCNRLLHMGITTIQEGERITLETGAVAWLERPTGKGPFPGALFFHGADRDGSRQASAIVLQRALLDAGFLVLSVDHPGYGESPNPTHDDDIAAWNPFPTDIAALKTLRSRPDVNVIFVIGHSMGTESVIRMLSIDQNLLGAIIFGGSLKSHKEANSQYWYERFHSDRGIPYRISKEKYHEIIKRFSYTRKTLQILLPDHAPVLFVRFGQEHQDIIATRDDLFDAIPGRKTTWDLVSSTHYFSSKGLRGLIVGDTRITRVLVSRFRLLAAKSLDAP